MRVEDIMTLAQVEQEYGVKADTLRSYIARGQVIPRHKLLKVGENWCIEKRWVRQKYGTEYEAIVNKKKYNTKTANLLASFRHDGNGNIMEVFTEGLYRKRTGEYFLFGEGGPLSDYSIAFKDGRLGEKRIIPMSEEEAKEWALRRLSSEEYEALFGTVEE